jgi:hypothetical protein
MTRTSYQDQLPEGITAEPLECESCRKIKPAWALYQSLPGEPKGFICGECITDAARIVQAKQEALNRVPDALWTSDYGKQLKAERDATLARYQWTQGTDNNLTIACRAAWLRYLQTVQNMTLTCKTTLSWVWPDKPKMEYNPVTVSVTVK